MKYIISFNDLTETKEFNLFEGFNDNSYNKRSDKIKVGRGKFKLTKWETGHINAIRMQYLSHQPIQIIRDIQGEVICLHFMCKGGINLNKIKPLIQKPFQHINNTNNLSFMKNNKTVFKVGKDEEIESFDIFITSEFLKLLSIKHPVLFKKLYEKIKKETPFKLCRNYMTTTFDMQQAIKQIKNLPSHLKTASLYLEAKVMELLALQLEQVEKQNCANCTGCFLRYKEQIIDAKNIIEQQFKKPPSIHRLALMVGMNGTQLKAGFKILFKNTIYGYLFEYRMNMSQNLLHEPSMTIADVANYTGYEHQSHFSTAFKRKFGITPKQYQGNILIKI